MIKREMNALKKRRWGKAMRKRNDGMPRLSNDGGESDLPASQASHPVGKKGGCVVRGGGGGGGG